MGLFEIIGESFNPGSTGSVGIGGRQRPPRSNGERMVRFIIASILLLGSVTGLCYLVWPLTLTALAAIFGGLALYLLLGYFVRPRADTENLGLAGGLIDNPFRYSDDINRSLLFFQIVLWPGRFIGESYVDFFRGGE